jgi:hypothetical protein
VSCLPVVPAEPTGPRDARPDDRRDERRGTVLGYRERSRDSPLSRLARDDGG